MSVNFGRSKTFLTHGNKKMAGSTVLDYYLGMGILEECHSERRHLHGHIGVGPVVYRGGGGGGGGGGGAHSLKVRHTPSFYYSSLEVTLKANFAEFIEVDCC